MALSCVNLDGYTRYRDGGEGVGIRHWYAMLVAIRAFTLPIGLGKSKVCQFGRNAWDAITVSSANWWVPCEM